MLAGDYTDTIRAWQKHRNEGLRAPDSWLSLVGLFWLKQGDNTIGSADTNDFVLPKGSAPGKAGVLHVEGGNVTYTASGGKAQKLSYPAEEDVDGKPDIAKAGRISFVIIKRGDRLALRARDSESPVLKNFRGMDFFPVNPDFRFRAKFIPDAKKIAILDVTGRTEMQQSPGHVEFAYRGKNYTLRPIFEGEKLFFLFTDPTNKSTTYQAGRMLNTAQAADGFVDLDFNRAYNPPCTFTVYATCPRAPKENRLTIPVEAGEKRYGKGEPEAGTK